MGGRGSAARGGNNTSYETVGKIGKIKVLRKKEGQQKLPEESHKSNAYIQLADSGEFKVFRWYDKNHFLRVEVAYHSEPELDPTHDRILHIHRYRPDGFKGRTKRLLTPAEFRRYKKILQLGDHIKWKTQM